MNNLQKKIENPSKFEAFNDFDVHTAIGLFIEEYNSEFHPNNIVLVEISQGLRCSYSIFSGYLMNDGKYLINIIDRHINKSKDLPTGFLLLEVPVFSKVNFYLLIESDCTSEYFIQYSRLIALKISNILEYTTVTYTTYQRQIQTGNQYIYSLFGHDFQHLIHNLSCQVEYQQDSLLKFCQFPNYRAEEQQRKINEEVKQTIFYACKEIKYFRNVDKYTNKFITIRRIIHELKEIASLIRVKSVFSIETDKSLNNNDIEKYKVCGILKLVLTTLLINSAEAIERNRWRRYNEEIKILIKLSLSLDLANRLVKFILIDYGKGMSNKTQQLIFSQPFSSKGSGRGYGLYFSKRILETMDGEIRLLGSKIGKGSTFLISMPILKR